MTHVLVILFLVLLAVALAWWARGHGAAYFRWRGTRIVTCPETGRDAAVWVDAWRAAWRPGEARLRQCSRWPERGDCARPCLAQLERDPLGCRLWSILADWYRERSCVLCGHAFGQIQWHQHKPALLAPDGWTREWSWFEPQEVPGALRTHRPVCWNCHIAESFRRMYPERVTERTGRLAGGR